MGQPGRPPQMRTAPPSVRLLPSTRSVPRVPGTAARLARLRIAFQATAFILRAAASSFGSLHSAAAGPVRSALRWQKPQMG
jgi:hypothetical protein